MKKIIFSLVFFLMSFLSIRAENSKSPLTPLYKRGEPEYPCYKITEKPTIDGKIEENVWSNIPAATGFYILGRGEYALEKQTYFKAGWNKEGIYIAIKCEEPDVEKIVAKQFDGGNLWAEDSIELFFFPKESNKYSQFIVNAIGSKWNAISLVSSTQFSDWQSKTFIEQNYWSIEVKIPFDVLGRIPENGEKWAVNIARNILTGPNEERYTCWTPFQSGFNDVSKFGFFIFKEKQLSLDESKNIEKEINFSYYNYLKNRINKIANYFPEYKQIIEKAVENPKFKEEGIYLKERWQLINEISQKQEIDIEELRSAKSYNLLQRSKTLKLKILLESLFEGE